MAGLDTGSWLLAEAGLLDGYRATIHWEELMRFAERFPEVATERARFVIDGSRITCSGAMAAFDMVMHMIRRNHGAALALEVAQLFMTSDSARSDAGTARAGGALVNRALALMQETLETPLTVAEIARRCGASQKRLENAMSTDLGASPRTIYRRLRLNLARKLASETELPVAEIAMRSGYDNASAMTRAFRTEFGTTPRMLRQSGIEML
ncbi:GlxA family transcriptional regulator [Salinihabitans flavidus]|uniref:GlxA family transcriptional regulator n=1 Tax=Salinihabitans flavidus TaxID=569882 RepID=UPI0031830EA7